MKGERLATSQSIPLRFLENILLQLRHAGIVESRRGADGGYRLARPAEEITLADVIRAIDGPLAGVSGAAPGDAGLQGPLGAAARGLGRRARLAARACSSRSRWPTSPRASCPTNVRGAHRGARRLGLALGCARQISSHGQRDDHSGVT